MQYAYTGRANIVELPIVAKASGDPITAGTVNFYLAAKDGANAGKWYRGSDLSWQAAESIAGAATHRADGHWYLSLPIAVWTSGVRYRLYAKESGNLHISVGEDVIADVFSIWDENKVTVGGTWDFSKAMKVIMAWTMGLAREKTGSPGTVEILDPDDGTTVIAELARSDTTPYKTVTVKI
jgi:hypothetical protein